MTVRMTFPPFVTRAATRIALGGVRGRGGDCGRGVRDRADATWRRPRRVPRRAQGRGGRRIRGADRRLDQAVRAVTVEPEMLRRAERGDARPQRAAVRPGRGERGRTNVAVTIYGAANQPVAWFGRSEDVPDARLSGPASTFLAQSSQGLQLVRVAAHRRSGRAGAAHRRDRRRSAAAADRRRAARLGVLDRNQHRAGRAAAAVRRRVGCRARRLRHSLADRTSRSPR